MEGSSGKIYEAISNVMAEIGAIGKDKKNQQQGFMYRGIDDVMNALQPALIKHKVFIVPDVLTETREERTNKNGTVLFYTRLEIVFMFYAVDGSFVSAKVIGEAMDSGDKATNKAMSIGYKYACFQVFCIPTEEMLDPDAECHEPAPKNGEQQKPQRNKQQKQAADAGAKNAAPAASPPPAPMPTEPQMTDAANHIIDHVKVSTIRKELVRTGVREESICSRYGLEKLEDCTEGIFIKAMNALKKTPNKEGK